MAHEGGRSVDRNAEVLDHGIGEELFAHGFQLDFGLGLVGAVKLQVENLALTNLMNAVEADLEVSTRA